jgi:hypothetical protein
MATETRAWSEIKVYGRDEVLADIERRSNEYAQRVVSDTRMVMNDFEVDIYRIILEVGKRYGIDTAYEIMSDTVVEKRMRCLDQMWDSLELSGTDLENGFQMYIKYLKAKDGDYSVVEKTPTRIVFKRKEYINAISHTCKMLGLDILEVQNKIYARATDFQLARISPRLHHVVLKYEPGWYEEMIELR